MYIVSRNSLGVVDAVNRASDGATIPRDNPDDPLTIEFNAWLDENLGFDLSNHAPLNQSDPLLVQNIGAFRVAMLADPGYNRIAAASAHHHIAALAAAIVVTPIRYASVVDVWNLIIYSLPPELKPTPGEVQQWSDYAAAAQVPLEFNTAGYLISPD